MKEFSKFEIAALKRNAANVYSYIVKKNKLIEKYSELAQEITELEDKINRMDTPTREITGGFGTEDIFTKEQGKFVLKYPDVIPDIPNTYINVDNIVEDTVDEVETPVNEAEFNPINN